MNWGSLIITEPVTALQARRIELGMTRGDCARAYAQLTGTKVNRGRWRWIEGCEDLTTCSPDTVAAITQVLQTTVEKLMAGKAREYKYRRRRGHRTGQVK